MLSVVQMLEKTLEQQNDKIKTLNRKNEGLKLENGTHLEENNRLIGGNETAQLEYFGKRAATK